MSIIFFVIDLSNGLYVYYDANAKIDSDLWTIQEDIYRFKNIFIKQNSQTPRS